jgi:hypothetical protein
MVTFESKIFTKGTPSFSTLLSNYGHIREQNVH